ncbi:Dopamine receptor 2 [Schistosoma japonicum]|uniref:Dopamine receptor 2 n=1 Tax=Schistosoma japonicum TaxID=6182 RepID=A0A4Z2DSJ6_SCHJA|nr:Dopamine receptor 2 [Schistosoma japonicum]
MCRLCNQSNIIITLMSIDQQMEVIDSYTSYADNTTNVTNVNISNINREIFLNNTVIDDSNVWKTILPGILLIIAALLTISGNLLVCLAFLRERYMRKNLTNWFLVSLAIADLLVGIIVMPFAIYHTLYEAYWPFGRDWCDIWHAFDVLSSTASILNLCAIALERFWATENPITHTSMRTRRHCLLMLASVWICSVLISFPAILWWRNTKDYLITSSELCQFTSDSIYLFVSSCVSFYIPLTVMLIVYARIYRTASNLMKSFKTGEKIVIQSNSKPQLLPCFNVNATNMFNEQKQNHWLKQYQSKMKSNDHITSQLSMSQRDRMILRIHRGGNVTNNYNSKTSNPLITTKFKTYSKHSRLSFNYFEKEFIKRRKMNDSINYTNSLCLNKHKSNIVPNTNTIVTINGKSCILSNKIISTISKHDSNEGKIGLNQWNPTNSLMRIPLNSQLIIDNVNNSGIMNSMHKQQDFKRSHSFNILNCLSQSQDNQQYTIPQHTIQQIVPCHSSTCMTNLQIKQLNSSSDYLSTKNDRKYSKNQLSASNGKYKQSVARLSMNQQNIINTSLINCTTMNNTLTNANTTMTSTPLSSLDQNEMISLSKTKCWINQLREFARTKRICKFVREQKAAKTLGIIMGLFILCWLPFFICNILIAFNPYSLNNSDIFKQIYILVTWLGYINSCINPIIYAHSMREFRRAFKRLLCCHWWHQKQIQLRKSNSFTSRHLSHCDSSQRNQRNRHNHHHHHHSRYPPHSIHYLDRQHTGNQPCNYQFETVYKMHQPTVKYPNVTDYQSPSGHLLYQNHETSNLSYSIILPNMSDSMCSKNQ